MRFDSLDEFKDAVVELPSKDAERVREQLVAERLDAQQHARASGALALRQFPDGLAYIGYLWDFLLDKKVIAERELWARVEGVPMVLAMWDLHPANRVRIPDYFKFPKGTVLSGAPSAIKAGLTYLPEDLYVFDQSFKWVGALTHEFVDNDRFCIWSG